MAITPPPGIDPSPPVPIRGDRTTFSNRVDAFVTWLANAVSQFGAVAANVYQNALDAFSAASTASSASTTATGAATTATNAAQQATNAQNTVVPLATQVQQNAALADTARQQAEAAAAGAQQTNMGGSTGYPPFPPSMLNDWANGRFLSPVFNRTRALAATYTDALGRLRSVFSGEPVFEWDATGRCRGLRIEPSRQNLFTYSEQFDNAAWSKLNLTVAPNTGTSPDGSLTADKLVPNATAGLHSVSQGRTVAAGPVAFSIHAMRAEYSRVRLQVGGVAAARVDFDLVAGTFSNVTVDSGFAGGITPYILPLPTGGYRIGFSGTVTAAGGLTAVTYVGVGTAGDVFVLAGDGTSGVYTWGAQLEQGSAPSSYIPTTTAAVTRPADVITLPASEAAQVLNPAQGAFLVEFTLNAVPIGGESFDVLVYANTPEAERIVLRVTSANIQAVVITAGSAVAIAVIGSALPAVGARCRVAFAYSAGRVAGSVNGAAVVAATPSATYVGTWDRLYVGRGDQNATARILNGHIACLHHYARIPSDVQLRAMSGL